MGYPADTSPKSGQGFGKGVDNINAILEAAADGTRPLAVDSGGGGGEVTPNQANIAASASADIPAGAKGYLAMILTGTGSIGAATGLPAGVSAGSSKTQASAITVTADADSSAVIFWET